ncbi:MAG: tetratricopeptide repeat protein [Betaproteobacteria bacterium]
MVSVPSVATIVPIVNASGPLQQCLGIDRQSQTMTHGPATRRYCEQLPASDVYNQAGVRFQAGDHAGAAKILERAAAAGNAVAQLRLALLYDTGDGVPRSAKTAMQWYARAAAQGEPESQNQMGLFFELGQGVPENWDLAAQLFRASALQGWMKGQFSLARAYQFGIGLPQSRALAIDWYQKSAAHGDAKSDYFAKWLRDSTNNIGFRDDSEHAMVIGSKLRFGTTLMGGIRPGSRFTIRHSACSGCGVSVMCWIGKKPRCFVKCGRATTIVACVPGATIAVCDHRSRS